MDKLIQGGIKMQYRIDPKSGNKLSILGFGCMRFPRNPVQIDIKKTEKMVVEAVENGVNYFDTAYIYGGSEEALGPILHKNKLREKIFLATKLPLGHCKTYADFDRLLNTQLDRLKTNYIDYYFMHNLSDMENWKSLCDIGVEKWIEEKKAEGKIKQVGFSFHGSQGQFFKLLDAYPWDFCQIQYNYMNINYQAGEAGLKKAAEMGLPVFAMEPLLGGKLATGLPKKAASLFKEADPAATPVSWALKWLWNQPEVTVVLSGMSSDAQLSENIALANAEAKAFTQKDFDLFKAVEKEFNSSYKIPCTGCNYCMPCPSGVNIPGCFAGYNMLHAAGFVTGLQQYITGTGASDPQKNYGPSRCTGCGKCERHCPQHIPIVESLKDVKKRMEPFWFNPAMKLVNRVMRG